MSYGITRYPTHWRSHSSGPKPDSMTPEQHDAFLAELAEKYPAPRGVDNYKSAATKKDKLAFLRHKLATDLHWAAKAVVQIHKLQTSAEQQMEATTDHNGVGFTGFDARGMNYLADWINKQVSERGKDYAQAIDKPKFIRKLHKSMPRYADQLRRIADGELTVPE